MEATEQGVGRGGGGLYVFTFVALRCFWDSLRVCDAVGSMVMATQWLLAQRIKDGSQGVTRTLGAGKGVEVSLGRTMHRPDHKGVMASRGDGDTCTASAIVMYRLCKTQS